MKPLSLLTVDAVQQLRGIIFDLDDTLLDHGLLTAEAYASLFRLKEAGLRLIVCTGRPAGWGEVIQRQWPLDGTVTENGAVAFGQKGGRIVLLDSMDRQARRNRREQLVRQADEMLVRFPRARLADDNDARVTDVTIDIGEHCQVPPYEVRQMQDELANRGIRSIASSVHLHMTCETYDKASGVIRYLSQWFNEDPTSALHWYGFIGDSGNDAAAFAAFRLTFGVANVDRYVAGLSVPPRFVASDPRGLGFAEISRRIVELRLGCR